MVGEVAAGEEGEAGGDGAAGVAGVEEGGKAAHAATGGDEGGGVGEVVFAVDGVDDIVDEGAGLAIHPGPGAGVGVDDQAAGIEPRLLIHAGVAAQVGGAEAMEDEDDATNGAGEELFGDPGDFGELFGVEHGGGV